MSEPETHDDEPEGGLIPQNVVDTVAFGRRLRSLRVLHGYDRVTDFVNILRSQYGVDVSDRTVYAIERGEQMPHLDFFIASMAALASRYDYFWPAVRHDVVEKIRKQTIHE